MTAAEPRLNGIAYDPLDAEHAATLADQAPVFESGAIPRMNSSLARLIAELQPTAADTAITAKDTGNGEGRFWCSS